MASSSSRGPLTRKASGAQHRTPGRTPRSCSNNNSSISRFTYTYISSRKGERKGNMQGTRCVSYCLLRKSVAQWMSSRSCIEMFPSAVTTSHSKQPPYFLCEARHRNKTNSRSREEEGALGSLYKGGPPQGPHLFPEEEAFSPF